MRPHSWMMLAAAAMIVALAACAGQLQDPCTESSDCAKGLECLQPKLETQTENCRAASLTQPPRACNLLCETDDDCAALGDDVGCFHFGCPGSDAYCVQKNSRGEPIGVGADGGS
ncbi:MAG: hypothetical protein IRZ16_08995 [Myxococcaceae bacterium]|nr:hypothetical protein [Myxococcaceae bacterium]